MRGATSASMACSAVIAGSGSAGGGVGSTISFWLEVTWENTSFTVQPAQALGLSQSASVS